MSAAWLWATDKPSGAPSVRGRLQAQWPLQTPWGYRQALGLQRAYSASQGLVSSTGGRRAGQASCPAPRGEGRALGSGELKRIEQQIMDAGLMPDD